MIIGLSLFHAASSQQSELHNFLFVLKCPDVRLVHGIRARFFFIYEFGFFFSSNFFMFGFSF